MNEKPRHELPALLEELAELAGRAPARLGERMAALGIREQAELALRLPARHRLELLLHAPKPMRLVRSLPDFEFYLTTREVGPTDALPLVSLASAPQLQHLLDLESWRGDRFDGVRSGAWVALLLEAGEPTIRRFVRAADDDQLALLFQRWFRVEPIVPEDVHGQHGHGLTEAGDERGLVSPDGNYRFRPQIKDHAPVLQRVAQLLYVELPERYQRAVWSALYELPAELEEQALRWRQSRLEEHGFPPWDEALAVYAPPLGVRAHPEPPPPTDRDGLAAPLTPAELPVVRERLGGALDGLSGAARDRVLREFVSLGNHLLVADGGDTGEPTSHRAALEKAAGYVGLALETRGAARDPQAGSLLERIPVLELFREGYSRAAELQARARAMLEGGWAAAHPRARDLLDSPIGERIAALVEGRPQYVELDEHGNPGAIRPFRSAAEIDETAVGVEIAEVVGQLMIERLGLDLSRALDPGLRDRAEPTRFSTFLLTLLAWHAARGELRGDPLPDDVLADFLRGVASRRTADAEAPERALESWLAHLADALQLEARETSIVGAFGRACLRRLSSECASLDPGVPVDPRDLGCLLILGRNDR